jgi:arylsulfatase A-like enzyme
LLIVFDTARADAFEPYGAGAGSSPVVADLARRGGALPKMFAPACWTIPSHSSLFTGLLPRANGLIRAPEGRPAGCRPVLEAQSERLLSEVFRRAGYRTGAISTNLWLTERSGFDLGFDEFVAVDTQRQAALHLDDLRSRVRWGLEAVRARADDGGREAGRILSDWVDRPGEQPFFCFVNLIECHSPYLPPSPFNSLGPLERWRAADEARRHLTLDAIWKACAGGFDVPPEAIERMRTLYADAIRLLDDWLGSVLDGLDRSGILDETLVVVTSDHGENLGESGMMGHAFSLDQRLLHLPCVTAGPGAFQPQEAHSLAALPRLLAEAVGIDEHPWRDSVPEGIAVAQFDPPAGRDDPRMLKAIEHWGLGEEALDRIATPFECATDGRLKLVRRGGNEIAYDLQADPGEESPLAPGTVGADLDPLRAALEHPGSKAVWGREGPMATAESGEEASDLEDRMRLLGYL